jgi:hypothetical protein
MTLYLNLTGDRSSGWEGYDIAVSRSESDDNGSVVIERYSISGFETIGSAEYLQEGKKILYKLPRELFGSRPLDFEFKWADNVGNDDIMDFYCDGDTAPTGRFNYVYRETGFPVKEK